jgi:hypothetical protein
MTMMIPTIMVMVTMGTWVCEQRKKRTQLKRRTRLGKRKTHYTSGRRRVW